MPLQQPQPHRMLFVRDLLRCEELPGDGAMVSPALRSFVFGNPAQRLERIRCLGTVVQRCAVPVMDGLETLAYLDDGSGIIPIVLPRSVEGAPQPAGPSVTWRCDPAGPDVGDVIEVFGSLHSGEHPALEDVDGTQRYLCAASWVRQKSVLQESSRALEIQQLCALPMSYPLLALRHASGCTDVPVARTDEQHYFRDGLNASGFGNLQAAPIAQPRTHPKGPQGQAQAQQPQQPTPKRPHARPLSSEVLLEFLVSAGGGATRTQMHQWYRTRLGCAPTAEQAEQLQRCLTALQESFAIYEDGDGRFCPM